MERLGDIVANLDNRRVPLNSIERDAKTKKGLYPYIGANNIVGYIDEYIFDEKILCVAEDGGSWGSEQVCANIYEGKTWVNNHAHVLVENGKGNLEYLKFYLNYANLSKLITGTTRGKLTRTALDSIRVPLPSMPLQIQIANLLSKSEDLIKQRKESIELLDKFLEGTFYEMFGDATVGDNLEKIGAHLVLTGGAAFKSSDFIDEGIPVIKIGTVNKGFFDTKTLSFLPETFLTSFERYIIRPGDLLLSLTGTVGKDDYGNACFATSDYESYLLNQRVAKINVDEAFLNLHFVYYLFKFPKFKHSLIKADRGVRQANLSNNDIYNLKISYPPIQQQNDFASIVEKAESLKKYFTESLNELENLFGSLNQRAFKEELEFKERYYHYIRDADMGDDGLGWKREFEKIEVQVQKELPKEGLEESKPSTYETLFPLIGKVIGHKPQLKDVQLLIKKHFKDEYFIYEDLKQKLINIGFTYDFETLKNFVFELLRQGELKQVFADAAFKSSFKESDANFKKIKELNEQMYLQQAATTSL
jgi:type I restriction enzyme S subunit